LAAAGNAVPATLSTIPRLSPADVQVTRDFSFDGMSRINGQKFEMDRVDFSVPLGQTELWRFQTNGNAPHPVHVHGASFQVFSRTGGRGALFPWEASSERTPSRGWPGRRRSQCECTPGERVASCSA
jgi:FtsP/CotA-like multicopper oxidase with cupredoxin domain